MVACCRALAGQGIAISPRTFHAWRRRPPSARARRDEWLTGLLRAVFEPDARGRRRPESLYGAVKIWGWLARQDITVARCTIERLMRANGWRGRSRGRRKPRTTVPDPAHPRHPDLVRRDFRPPGPGRLLVAEKIASVLTGVSLTGSGECITGGSGTLPAGFAGRFISDAEKEIGVPYVWGGGTYTGPSGEAANGEPGFDCSGLVLYAAYQASGGKIRLLHYTGDQINETRPVSWADKQPGDIIFYTYPGASEPHHVVIYLGGDRIFQAPETGQDLGYGTLSEFTGQIASVRRITEP